MFSIGAFSLKRLEMVFDLAGIDLLELAQMAEADCYDVFISTDRGI